MNNGYPLQPGDQPPAEAASSTFYGRDDQRWHAVRQRDPDADGHFVYGVRTTRIYCRPTCPARRAFRQHVVFFDTNLEAERAGFRPCARCQPADLSPRLKQAARIGAACRLIETADKPPPLQVLARAAGLSRHHFHRLFKAVLGLTPRQYGAASQTQRVRSALRREPSITAAIYDAGYSSSSRFYEQSSARLGMTPREFQNQGEGVSIQYAFASSPLGLVLVAGTRRGICAVRFGSCRAALERELRAEFPRSRCRRGGAALQGWVSKLVEQIGQPAARVDLPLDIRGTAFQERVWQALRRIPPGQTATYSEVAAALGQATAVRAVSGACAANPVAAIIPCHRVVRRDGRLSGYRWGVRRKQQLLRREAGQSSGRTNPAAKLNADPTPPQRPRQK